MIHILEVISDTNMGGAGRLLLARLEKTNREKIRTTVLLPKGSLLKEELIRLGICTVEVVGGADRSLDPIAVLSMVRVIHHLRPDLLHAHGSLSARIAARICGVPISIYTRHCAYPLKSWERLSIVRLMQRWLCDLLSDCVVAVSPAAQKNLLQLGIRKKRIVQIINGSLPLHRLSEAERSKEKQRLGIPDDAFVVGICARLEPCKDHTCFLRAARLLTMQRNSKQKYRFLIVGDGSLKEELVRQCHRMGLSSYTIFTGFLKDPSRVMNLFDINVNCSVGTETSSLALSEGMSIGVPVVASDYGGNVYMVKNGENGFLYHKGNSSMLADRIRFIAKNPRLRKEMSIKAKARYERELNAEAMTKQYERLYQLLVERKQQDQEKLKKSLARGR